tara:strand:+ start:162 stop:464 length:303 start_codon:yes stop_codon:yes gene_type:complete
MMKKKNAIVVCADGFSMSVQANKFNYSSPRNDVGPYHSCEVGFPSAYDFYLNKYAEDPENPTETVYGWVPAHVIRMCIDAHGGMVEGELPNFDEAAWNGE